MVAGEQKLEVALPSVCRFEDADASEGEKGLWLSPLSLLQVSSDQNANCCKQEDRSVPSPLPALSCFRSQDCALLQDLRKPISRVQLERNSALGCH